MTVYHADFGNPKIDKFEENVATAIDEALEAGVAPVTVIGLLHVYAQDVTATLIEEDG